ncbi:MAG: hypothetical protein HYU39_08855 [Thaumarchaeota archaeon]|nr:hypothetical protein [Nitrososphaerota archaeon]
MLSLRGDAALRDEETRFEKMLSESILDVMIRVLGTSGMQAVLLNLELSRFAGKPRDFHRRLSHVFGDGAVALEAAIVKELYRKLGIQYNNDVSFDFLTSISSCKSIFVRKQGKQKRSRSR